LQFFIPVAHRRTFREHRAFCAECRRFSALTSPLFKVHWFATYIKTAQWSGFLLFLESLMFVQHLVVFCFIRKDEHAFHAGCSEEQGSAEHHKAANCGFKQPWFASICSSKKATWNMIIAKI